MTDLEILVLERLQIELSNNIQMLKQWNISDENQLVYMRLLSKISDKDKNVLEKELKQEKLVVVTSSIQSKQAAITAETAIKTKLTEDLNVVKTETI